MFSLQQLFGEGDKFFGLLEASSEEARNSVRTLVEFLKSEGKRGSMEEFVLTRRKEKRITEQISEELVRTFVTGLEREEIEALSHALYKIPKTVEKFAERYSLAAGQLKDVDFSRQAEAVEKTAEILVQMVKVLRKLPPLEKVKELNDRLQYLEGEADKVMLELLKELYSGKYDPIKTMIAKDLYELLEKVIDRCRDAGSVVTHIVLKNS
ncbi:MAG: DUF47 domain-containing protein [Verrucomicrobiota bacterium]|jgi:uncharacterized protein Yka (UPF0111/DUF47 family)